MSKRLTLFDLFKAKDEGRQLTQVFTIDPLEAAACEAAGIEMIMTGANCIEMIREAAPNTFVSAGLMVNNPEIASEREALSAGFKALRGGADAVYTGLSTHMVSVMAREKIPVMGHIGFVPYRRSWVGGFRAVGKTADEAIKIYEDALRYQDAGAIAVEIEIVPEKVTEEIAKRLDILLISMGAGVGGAVQYLFATDLLGTNEGHIPRHAKVYADLKSEYARLQQIRIDAFKAWHDDVASGEYPQPKHLLKIKDEEFEKFFSALDGI